MEDRDTHGHELKPTSTKERAIANFPVIEHPKSEIKSPPANKHADSDLGEVASKPPAETHVVRPTSTKGRATANPPVIERPKPETKSPPANTHADSKVTSKPPAEDHLASSKPKKNTPPASIRLAVKIKATCGKPIENGPPKVYKLPVKVVMKKKKNH